MQNLDVQLSITIPSNLVLIERLEYRRLQEMELNGQWWSMKDLEARTSKKVDWIKENILYVHRFRRLLDVESGGFVYYPKTRGETWAFQAPQMAEFLDKHFRNIYTK